MKRLLLALLLWPLAAAAQVTVQEYRIPSGRVKCGAVSMVESALCYVSSGSSAWSFASFTASSSDGTESRTMPSPA